MHLVPVRISISLNLARTCSHLDVDKTEDQRGGQIGAVHHSLVVGKGEMDLTCRDKNIIKRDKSS